MVGGYETILIMTTDQTNFQKTSILGYSTTVCCGIRYEICLTNKGVLYCPLNNPSESIIRCIECHQLLTMDCINLKGYNLDDKVIEYKNNDHKKELEQWQMIKKAEPMSGFIQVLSVIGKVTFIVTLMIFFYQSYGFIAKVWQ